MSVLIPHLKQVSCAACMIVIQQAIHRTDAVNAQGHSPSGVYIMAVLHNTTILRPFSALSSVYRLRTSRKPASTWRRARVGSNPIRSVRRDLSTVMS